MAVAGQVHWIPRPDLAAAIVGKAAALTLAHPQRHDAYLATEGAEVGPERGDKQTDSFSIFAKSGLGSLTLWLDSWSVPICPGTLTRAFCRSSSKARTPGRSRSGGKLR